MVGAVALYSFWRTGRGELNEALEQRAHLAAVALEGWVDAGRQPLETIAAYNTSEKSLPREYLHLMVTTRPQWIDLRIYDRERREVWSSSDAPFDEHLREQVFSILAARERWAIATDWADGKSRPAIAIGEATNDGGAVIARVRASALEDIFREVELSDGVVLTVFDPQGRILYRSLSPQEYIGTDSGDSPLLAALGNRHTALVEIESPSDGVRRVHGLARAGATNCVVKLGVPSEVLYRPARRQFIIYLICSLTALGCALFAAVLIARRIAHPIRTLRDMAHNLSRDKAEDEAGETTTTAHIIRDRDAGGAHDEGDEVVALSQAFYLMSARIKEREAWLRTLNKRLSELNDLKSEIVSGVSHELRTPLTTIKMLARLLRRDELGADERRESLDVIALECDRQIDLVQNLLDLSRIESGAVYYTMNAVDLLQVLRDCLRVEQHAAKSHAHTLAARLPETLPFVRTDRQAIRRVLCTLIENAIKYTPDGGRITLAATTVDDASDAYVEISIADTGRGIAAADLPHVFEKFYRGHHASETHEGDDDMSHDAASAADYTAETPGVGLGLYLARTIIEQLDGEIYARSELHRGSTFTVRLPVWQTHAAEAENERHVASVVSG